MLSGNNMKIEQFGTLQLQRSNEQYFGRAKINNSYENQFTAKKSEGSFQSFLLDAMNTVNTQQTDVSKIQEKLITDPDSVDIHDVTIAMSKARLSLNLAQNVIDRLVSGWNEITTTR